MENDNKMGLVCAVKDFTITHSGLYDKLKAVGITEYVVIKKKLYVPINDVTNAKKALRPYYFGFEKI